MQTTEMANSDLDKYYKALDGFVFPCLVRSIHYVISSNTFISKAFVYSAYDCYFSDKNSHKCWSCYSVVYFKLCVNVIIYFWPVQQKMFN